MKVKKALVFLFLSVASGAKAETTCPIGQILNIRGNCVQEKGICGTGCSYVLDSLGNLYIKGDGNGIIKRDAFWGGTYSADYIRHVFIDEGIKEYGWSSFGGIHPSLESITFPETLTFHEYAFSGHYFNNPTLRCEGDIEKCREHITVTGTTFNLVQAPYNKTDSQGVTYFYDANGKLVSIQGKRILTVDEASALVKNNKNTFKLKYR